MELLFTYTVFSLAFTSGEKLLGPKEIGLNAQSFVYETSGKEIMNITFVLFSFEDQEAMQMNDSELLNYAKTTFLGTSKPAESFKERQIMGILSNGEVLSTNIPVASDLEIRFITTEKGEKYCIGFKSLKEMKDELRESIISDILGSLK